MQIATQVTQSLNHHGPCADSGSRPGLTSLIKTGRGIMTVQTEMVGEPARLVTIVDYRGRVLKSWQSSFLVAEGDYEQARKWHARVEGEVRDNLAKVKQRPPQRDPAAVGACLFVEAMQAYAALDYDRAVAILQVCDGIVPGDRRVIAALARLRALRSA